MDSKLIKLLSNLRWLACMLMLLLTPVAMLAEDYGLTVAGVQVTSNNATSGITGDNITGTVTFDESTNTLTLSGATINGNVVSSLAGDLTVHLVGTNTIHNGEHAFSIAGSYSLKFTADGDAKLLTDATTDEMFAYSLGNQTYIEVGDDDLPDGYKLSFDADLKRCIGEWYDIKIYAFTNDASSLGPQCVTSANCDRLAGYYDETTSTWNNEIITLSYDYATTTLTLNNMNIETATPNGTVYFLYCDGPKAKDITINILGNNLLRQFRGEEGARFIYNGAEDGSITITTAPENPGMLTMPDMEDYLEEKDVLGMYYTNHVNYENGLGYVKDENNVRYIKTLPSLGLTVAGVTVNEGNAGNVLNTVDEETELPTVVFDADNNTLSLNNAMIEGNIVSSLENLTVFLAGENIITCGDNSDFAFNLSSEVNEATITLTTDEESNGQLIIWNLEDRVFGSGVTPEYNYVSLKNNGDNTTIDSSCGISVGGVTVTEFNKSNVFGDNKVSYNATTHTLTLSNATIEPDEECAGIEYTEDEDLTIALIGNNSVQGSYGCAAIQKLYGVEPPYLHFVKGDANHCSLEMVSSVDVETIDGFYTNNEEGGFFWIGDKGDETHSTIVASSVFGGTGSEEEPFLIKTPEDLKKFANYYNGSYFSRNVHVQLYNDIDCKNLEDFTTIADNSDATFMGVFDGNHKTISNLTMTGMGLFGYVEKDGDDVGTIKDLTLSGLQLNGETEETRIGGIVAYLYEGAVVSNCTVVNSTIACESDTYNPYVAAIAAQMSGAIVTGCVVDNVKVKAETSYFSGSGPEGIAGGVVATAYGGTISSCVVRNGTKITDYYADENADLRAGAIVGKANGTTLTENYYYYDVIVEILNGTDETNKIIKSEYQQRGNGGKTWNEQTQQYEEMPDLFEDDGAVMYTRPVMLPEETEEASVMAEEGTYYSTFMEADALGLLVAPGQTVMLNVLPSEDYPAPSLTATNTTTEETIETSSEELGDNITQYSFTMPDAPVTVALTKAETVLQSPELHFWTSEYSYIGTGNSYGTLDYYELESFTSPTLKAKIDGNYTSELADFGITYSSSDNAIATIDATGKITFAGGAGVVTIKAVSQETDVYAADSTWFTITLRPSDPQASIESGAYFVGQKVTMIPTVSNGEMYYKIGWNGEKVKYTEPITLPKGITEISFYTLCSTKDGEMWSYGNNHPTYYVYDKLTFTPDSGTVSNDDIMVEIGNLPEANDYYPATVYYYFDDDEDNAKEYSSTTKVTVSESSTLKTFIEVRGDSGNVYRSEPVEAEYTVLPKTELNISYAQNSREWASYCAEADLETPEGLQAYVVSGITEDGVSVSEISYVPQGEGILLKRIAENVTEPIMAKAYMNDGPQQEMPVNWLLGTAASKTISTGSSDIFVLYNDGFTRAYKGSIPAHRAYLVITQSAPVSSRLSIFEDGETTSVIENREWRMENSGTSWYTLDGRKLQAEPTKAGVYIQKGQKKVVK